MDPQPIDDSLQARIPPDCPEQTREILKHAWSHDLSGVQSLIDTPGGASCQDPTTGETPLHAAIRACGPSAAKEGENSNDPPKALDTVRQLFEAGAIWNDLDNHEETPGCVALRLGWKALYNACVDAGSRAELLFHLFNEMDLDAPESDDDEEAPELVTEEEAEAAQETKDTQDVPAEDGKEVTSEGYLKSALTYSDGKLVDSDGNAVMMAWETDIMRKSVAALLPGAPTGKRILNVGLGMGIIDSMFAETKPARHHIIEAHPAVLDHLSQPDARFGSSWENSCPSPGAFKVHRGKWQEIVPKLLEEGELYDAIYFDTFGEDYAQLKYFFTEYIPMLLDEGGRFGFFNGLGADRQISYDVYRTVSEAHIQKAGLTVEWEEVDVDMKGLEEAGKGEWEGVRRRYWTLKTYFLPTCKFLE